MSRGGESREWLDGVTWWGNLRGWLVGVTWWGDLRGVTWGGDMSGWLEGVTRWGDLRGWLEGVTRGGDSRGWLEGGDLRGWLEGVTRGGDLRRRVLNTHRFCLSVFGFSSEIKNIVELPIVQGKRCVCRRWKTKQMFYLTTHSTHFIYGYMASEPFR